MDKIRILLIDDQPTFTFDAESQRPVLPEELETHFDLFWLQNASEARSLLNAFSVLSMRNPSDLSRASLPPEILIFDYALTQGGYRNRFEEDPKENSTEESEVDPTNVAKPLVEIMKEYGLNVRAKKSSPPGTGMERGRDRTGCYVGGGLARAFGAHPCGAIPTTAHVDTSNTDAAFYEWFNEQYFQIKSFEEGEDFLDPFEDKRRANPSWDNLIPLGVKSLQERMIELATSGLLRISLSCLQSLAEDPIQMRHQSVVMHSRYGRRDLPVMGLFSNNLFPGKENENAFVKLAKKWSERMLEAYFAGIGRNEFAEARDLAKKYHVASLSEESIDRYELSRLASLGEERNQAEEERLVILCAQFGLSPTLVQKSPESVKVTESVLKPLGKVGSSHEVVRWATLLLLVHGALQAWNDFPLGPLDEDVPRLFGDIGIDRVYELLEPMPESLFTFHHRKKTKWGREKDVTAISNQLKKLGFSDGTETRWGRWGLNVQDVLDNRPFNCIMCRKAIAEGKDPPKGNHTDGERRYSHGLRAGEGILLQLYADELEFPESHWPIWLKNAP